MMGGVKKGACHRAPILTLLLLFLLMFREQRLVLRLSNWILMKIHNLSFYEQQLQQKSFFIFIFRLSVHYCFQTSFPTHASRFLFKVGREQYPEVSVYYHQCDNVFSFDGPQNRLQLLSGFRLVKKLEEGLCPINSVVSTVLSSHCLHYVHSLQEQLEVSVFS